VNEISHVWFWGTVIIMPVFYENRK